MFLHLRSFSHKCGGVPKGVLERSLSTSTRVRHGGWPRDVILTLDPNKFEEKKQRRLDIGNLAAFTPHISLDNRSKTVLACRLYYDPVANTRTRPAYPPNTKAFLYYSISPERPRIGGELRLRVASSDDLASFESGTDLLVPNGQTWSRPLNTVYKRFYFPLYEKLREDQLVPDDLNTALSTLPSNFPKYRWTQLLYTFNDTFYLDFSTFESRFIIITEQGLARLRLHFCFDSRGSFMATPYTGSALARFERSKNPDHNGRRTVVLRFLKIITPAKCVIPIYDGYICCPREGELHRRTKHNKPESEWNVNIDKSVVMRGLQLLWDASSV